MRSTITICLFALLVFSFTPCKAEEAPKASTTIEKNVTLPPLSEYNQSKKLVAREYILGANDIISMEVFGIPEFTRELRVRPDGKVSVPFIDDLSVAGMSIPELQSTIKARYEEYLQDPSINIRLVESRPFIVYIAGAVVNPGSYEMNTVTNQSPYLSKPESFIERKTPLLSNILVAAGGVCFDADLENVQITNDYDKNTYQINLYEFIKNANSSQDIYLTAGDRIYIPRIPSPTLVDPEKYKTLVSSTIFQNTIPVKVVGYVNSPGLVNLNSQQSANLSSAIASAGGYLKDTAYIPSKVYISRADNNNKLVTVAVNPKKNDFVLMPNDIVYVPEKIMTMFGQAFGYTGKLVSPFYMFTNAYDHLQDF